MRIYKYALILESGGGEIELPVGAQIVHAADQRGVPTLWIKVDETVENFVTRRFVIIGTGHDIPDDTPIHRGTFESGPFVWHVFEGPYTGERSGNRTTDPR